MHQLRKTILHSIHRDNPRCLLMRARMKLSSLHQPHLFPTPRSAVSRLTPRGLFQLESQPSEGPKSALSMSSTSYDRVQLDSDTPTTDILRDFNIERCHTKWGLVIVRCAYSSKEDWDLFLSISKERARQYLQSQSSLDLWDTMDWTVIEDQDSLDNADIVESSEAFVKWRQVHGSAEVEGCDGPLTDSSIPYEMSCFPRYNYYIHVDSLTLQNVIYDHAEGVEVTDPPLYWDYRTRNSLLVVDTQNFLINKEFWEPLVIQHRKKEGKVDWAEIDEEDLYMKRVKDCDFFSLYVNLLDAEAFHGNFSIYSEYEPRDNLDKNVGHDFEDRLYRCRL